MPQQQDTIATATQRALSTGELLEMMLLGLPPRDLLFAQRVSTTFKDSINKSIKIQQKLFRRPQPKYEDGQSVLNPFILRILRHHEIPEHLGEILVCVSNEKTQSRLELKGDDAFVVSGGLRQLQTDDTITFYTGSGVERRAFQRRNKDTTYEDMLVADPPVNIRLFSHWISTFDRDLQSDKHTTMGELLDAYVGSLPEWLVEIIDDDDDDEDDEHEGDDGDD